MKGLTGKTRFIFFYNQGIRYGAMGYVAHGYYKQVDGAYDHLKNFKPFRPLEIGEAEGNIDFKAFELGFNKAKAQVIKVQKMKIVAEKVSKQIMADLEGEVSKQATHYTELEGYKADLAKREA